MRMFLILLGILISAENVFAQFHRGVVVSVDKMGFTIQPERGKKLTMRFGPDMAKIKNKSHPKYSPVAVTPDEIKEGMILSVDYHMERKILVCDGAMVIEEHLGPQEIDFGPMLVKDKGRLPQCRLRVQLYSRSRLGVFRPYVREFGFKEGTSLKDMRQEVKRILTADDWKVKEVGDTKLVVESRKTTKKDEPLNQVIIAAEGLPKEQQPSVRRINQKDPSK